METKLEYSIYLNATQISLPIKLLHGKITHEQASTFQSGRKLLFMFSGKTLARDNLASATSPTNKIVQL